MKLSEQLKQDHECGDFGKALAGYSERAAALELDAARYRWLRAQHWSDNSIAAVRRPKDAIKLGHVAPSRELLDAAIDEAMLKTPNDQGNRMAATGRREGEDD